MACVRSAACAAKTALVAAAAGLFGLATWRAATSIEPDYALHAEWARELAETGHTAVPHPLFHLLTIVVHSLLPRRLAEIARPGLGPASADSSYLVAALIVATGAYVALALVLFERLLGTGDASAARAWSAAGWSLALMLLGPISVFTWPAHQLYLGYIAPNVFHNPTLALLKPLALAWFWAVARTGRDKSSWRAAALLAVAATLAKPSFAVAFLPALAVWTALGRWLPQAVDTAAAIASLLAGGAVLAFQVWTRGAQPGLLNIAPLQVMGFYTPTWQMPFLLLLSIAFPLCLAAARRRTLRRDGALLLAWLAFAIAAAYGYLLAEAEPNTGDGNWLWSGQVALFVLLAQSVLCFRSRTNGDAAAASRARRLCALVFALQLACGLAWYAAEVREPHAWWFPFSESDE